MRLAKLSRRVPHVLRPWFAARLPLAGEVRRGASVGCVGGTALVVVTGGSLALLPLAVMGGSAAGALIGLLLWCGSAEEHQDPVVPPSPR